MNGVQTWAMPISCTGVLLREATKRKTGYEEHGQTRESTNDRSEESVEGEECRTRRTTYN